MAKQEPIWVSEEEAAKLVGLAPKYFRRKVSAGAMPKIVQTRPSRNKFEYDLNSINQHKASLAFGLR
jgi:hypothetical protein